MNGTVNTFQLNSKSDISSHTCLTAIFVDTSKQYILLRKLTNTKYLNMIYTHGISVVGSGILKLILVKVKRLKSDLNLKILQFQH